MTSSVLSGAQRSSLYFVTMSGKRILIITSELVPFHYGGIGTQFKSLAALLKRHGHHVSILARKPENYDANIYRSHYGEIPIFFVEVPSIQEGLPQHFVYAAEVARLFDEIYPDIKPDLVVIADYNAEGFFLLLRSVTGVYDKTEFLLTINGMNQEVISVHEGDRQGILSSIMDLPEIRSLMAMEDLCVNLAPKIVSPTVCAWEEIQRRLDIDKTALIIPNLIDPGLFIPDGSGPWEEKREPMILFVGRLDRMKGTDLLLRAYFEIADQMYPVIPRIIFIGRDCYWNEYGSTFLEYWKNRIPEKYAGSISFLGQVSHDQIRDYLKKATVSVFPSRWEPFGIVCLEAMAMGCPVVVSRGTGLEEVLGPALSEFAVPVTEDIQPLAQKILSLLHITPYAFSEKMRDRAQEIVSQAEAKWLDLIRDIDRKERIEEPAKRRLCSSLHQLLTSLENSWKATAHLQIYFRRHGGYMESDSIRVSYYKFRWTTLNIPLPLGTGERPLRLDPSDTPGIIRIREIVFFSETGNEIWRTDGSNNFQGCTAGGNDPMSVKDSCLFIDAKTDDPQIFLNCPITDRYVEMRVIISEGQ